MTVKNSVTSICAPSGLVLHMACKRCLPPAGTLRSQRRHAARQLPGGLDPGAHLKRPEPHGPEISAGSSGEPRFQRF